MKINRPLLLKALEHIQAGTTARDVVEQSSCFAFQNGEVMTYNDEIACRIASPLDITGAVQALPLLSLLRKLTEEEIDIVTEEGEFVVKGKGGRRSGIRMQSEVVLAIDKVDAAEEWVTLNPNFIDAIYVAQQCVSKDESNYAATCVHIHPKFIEACDNSQAIRYKIKTRVKQPFLVRGASIKHIVSLDMSEFCETPSWIHFRNSDGLILSCRRDVQPYESLDEILHVEGSAIILPKGLVKASELAELFSSENADENEVLVEIKPGKLKITGEGVSGWYSEPKKINYDGEPISFRVSPKLLIELVKQYNECTISSNSMKVEAPRFVYVVALGEPKTKQKKETQNADDET